MNDGNVVKVLVILFALSLLWQYVTSEAKDLEGLKDKEYSGCFGQVTIWLYSKGGYCHEPTVCLNLQNCSVLYGNLIFKTTQTSIEANQQLVKPKFPKLQEVTGFLVIVFYNFELFDLLPSLTVLRGNDLVGNYALIIYVNEVKGIYFRSLTTILHGGVRIDRNDRLCYAESVRWKSIVKDVYQTGKFGIVIKSNNPNCDKSCLKGKCYVGSGHGNNPNSQYCWGPGINDTDSQCQKFCDVKCGLEGCVDGSKSSCCHSNCLGGCRYSNSPSACHACKHYRNHTTGECVQKCADDYVLNENLYCDRYCEDANNFIFQGKCVNDCPAGYLKDIVTKTCKQCPDENSCSKVCNLWERVDETFYRGAVIKVPSDIKSKGLIGCAVINGSLSLQLAEGTGDTEEFTKELQTIRVINGHLKVQKSSMKTLSFFKNLEVINTPREELIHGRYAVTVYENSNLEDLWEQEKSLLVPNGDLFFQSNPRLCPQIIYKLQSSMRTKEGNNVTGDLSKLSNGNRVSCDIEELTLKVSEVKVRTALDLFKYSDVPASCIGMKCIQAEWNFTRIQSSYRIIFFKIYYKKLEADEEAERPVSGDYVGNKDWKSVDFEKPSAVESMDKLEITVIRYIKDLVPAAKYAFYLKEVLSDDSEGKTSKMHYVTISRGIPAAPMGFEASFLSMGSIKLEWQPPDNPNGEIVAYKIYWQKSSYSFWQDQKGLDWCKRDVKIGVRDIVKKKFEPVKDACLLNSTCVCQIPKTIKESVKEDRESHSFLRNFEDRIIQVIFTKKSSKVKKKNVGTKSSQPFFNVAKTARLNLTTDGTSNGDIQREPTANDVFKQSRKNVIKVEQPRAQVDGNVLEYIVQDLDYFQDYEFKVCACTINGDGGGCAEPRKTTAPVNLPCAVARARTASNPKADQLNGSINVEIVDSVFNVTWPSPSNPNAVVLKYEILIKEKDNQYKHCQTGSLPTYFVRNGRAGEYSVSVRAISPAGNGSWSDAVNFEVIVEQEKMEKKIVIGVSIAAVLLCFLLIVVIIYYSFVKRFIDKDSAGVIYASVNPEYMNSNGVYIPDEWELNREKIELVRELGQGGFGMVYEGIAYDIEGVPEQRVAVKTVNEKATIRNRIEFLQEASIMKSFDSNHVVRLIGVVSQGQPTLVVMELMERHDLKTFLRDRRPHENNEFPPPSVNEMYQMAAEIADGMAYLAARKFVHRDLAARNCMVALDFTVKIGDFGMARDIYETNYYRKDGKGLLPVRWMAPESLRDGVFKSASDVWSYGVVVWEICTLASQPYQGKSNPEVLAFVLDGGLPMVPEDCDEELAEIMMLCWQKDPNTRPMFLEIVRLLESYVTDDFRHCSFYHEMKKMALEDSFCENELKSMLSRRKYDTTSTRKKSSSTLGSQNMNTNFDSSTESSLPKLSFSLDSKDKERERLLDSEVALAKNIPKKSVIPSGLSHQGREKSLYDNYGTSSDNMRYGNSPVDTTKEEDVGKLKLNKIFLNKPVPV